MSASRRNAILWLGLCVVTVGVFYSGLGGEWLRDDISLIQHNTYVSDPSLAAKALTSSFWTMSGADHAENPVYSHVYRPIVTGAFIVQGQLFGMQPYGFHVVSLLLHVLCVLLAWQWLQERLPGEASPPKDMAVTLGAGIFALHPSRGESVAWVSGSTDLWMTLFVLVGLLVWNRRNARPWMAPLSGLLFGAAFLSKETAIVVPALVILDAWCLDPGPLPAKKLGTMAAAFGGVLLARAFIVPLSRATDVAGLVPDVWRRATSSLGHYVHVAFTEWTPSVQVALRRAMPGGEPFYEPWSIWVGATTVALVLVVAGAALVRAKVRPWFADLAWFVLPLVPVLNIIDMETYAMVSERFLYLPLLGVCSLAARLTEPLFERRSPVRAVVAGAALALLVSYGAVTAVHATHFLTAERLWTYELSVNPKNHAAVKSLEHIAWGNQQWDRALTYNLLGHEIAIEARESRLAMHFLLQAARRVMMRTSDLDQVTLQSVRAAYDGYLETGRFVLTSPSIRVDMKTREDVARDVTADLQLFRFPRAEAWVRTGALEGALEQARALVADHPTEAQGWSLVIQLLAQLGRWDEADRTLAELETRLPDHPLTSRAAQELRKAEALGTARADTRRARALREAAVHAHYRAWHSARRALDPWVTKEPGDFELVLARAKLDAVERRFDSAESFLVQGRASIAAEQREPWDRALAELRALRRSEVGAAAH